MRDMELLAGVIRKPFHLSDHLGARWGLVACAGVRPRCPFCSGEDGTRAPRRSFALPPGRAGLGRLLFLGKACAFERSVYPAQETVSRVLNKP